MHTELLAAIGWPEISEFLIGAWYLLLVLIGFSVIIFVHELGHFLMAKWVGIRVETFSIGFGPRLFGFKRGDTDYCLRALPLGGYVKMMGQEDFAVDQDRVSETAVDPNSFLAKTPGQRALVVSGGVVMNVIFAAIAFVVIFMHGWKATAPVVGGVFPGSPAAEAGIEPGDRFVSVNGSSILKFSELQLAIALSGPNQPLNIVLDRNGKQIETQVQPLLNNNAEIQQIGIGNAASLIVAESGMNAPGKENLRKGDEILKVGDETPTIYHDVEQALHKAEGKPVKLTVKRTVDGQETTVTVMKRAHLVLLAEPESFSSETAVKEAAPGQKVSVLGLMPRRSFFFTPEPESEARAKTVDPATMVQAGDVIAKVGETSNPSMVELREFFGSHRGGTVEITVLRESGEEKQASVYVPLRKNYFEMFLGQLGFDDMHPVVSDVVKDSPAASLNLPRSAIITACGEKPITSWFELVKCFEANTGKDVQLAYELNGEKGSVTMAVPTDTAWQGTIAYAVDFFDEPLQTIIKGNSPQQAFMLGMRETWTFVESAYVMLQRLAVDRTIGVKQLSGPVFIINKGREVAEAGFFMLLYYLALISANLAVINFLPIPVVDGGLMILLGLEKLRGKPLSGKATAVWQGVGLSLILLLFAFVTYNDIAKIVLGG
jgi:regulator of sigma E protease